VALDESISPGGFVGIGLVLVGLIAVGRTAEVSSGAPAPTGVAALP
jgi:hypothetical protein